MPHRFLALCLATCVAACGSTTGSAPPPRPGSTFNLNTSVAPVPTPGVQADSDRIPIGNSPIQGPATAMVTIVEFSDFQCPFCSRVLDTLRSVRQRYGDDVRIVWKNNPLPFHNNAMPAAEAALAAGAQGHFWEMHDLLFQNQANLARADLERYATYLGLDMERFRSDLDQHTFQAQIQTDQALAVRLNAQGTPNFFINGTNIVGAQPLERFTTLIDSVLATARVITPREQVYARMTASPMPGPDPPAPTPHAPTVPSQVLDPSVVYRIPLGNSPSLGPSNALVTIVEFGDFQCPFCGRVQPTLAALRTRYGADVRIVWKNQPLDFHVNAMPAAEAAMEAYAQRGNAGFWQYHDLLYQHQSALTRSDLETYAQQLQLDMQRFTTALDQHTHMAEIQADRSLATTVAANGTPHFFINGRRLVGAQPEDRFAALIDEVRATAVSSLRGASPTAQLYNTVTARGVTAPVYMPGPPTPAVPDPNRVYVVAPRPDAPARGGSGRVVVVEHFADFQCPFCSRVAPTLDRIVQTYGSRVRVSWRDYPLQFHANAMLAAEAAREVFAQQGNAGFWRFHDTLYSHQTDLDRASLERYAQAQNLNMNRFRVALDSHIHQAQIQRDIAAGDATGAEMGTPATFINGRLVSGAMPFESFQSVIDTALGQAPRRTP